MARDDRAETGFKFYPLELIKVGQYTSRALFAAEKVAGFPSFLIEMGTSLLEEGVSDTFGIATVHSPAMAKAGESWQETSDPENRVLKLILDVWNPTVEEQAQSVQTFYQVSDVPRQAERLHAAQPQPPAQPARVNCTGHHYCNWHCNGHHCVKHQVCRAHPRPKS